MKNVFVNCPACKTKTHAGHEECPPCEATLPAEAAPASLPDADPHTNERHRVRPHDIGLAVASLMLIAVITRSGEAPAARTPTRVVEPPRPRLPTADRQWARAGAYTVALEHFERAVADHPKNAGARHELAIMLVDLEATWRRAAAPGGSSEPRRHQAAVSSRFRQRVDRS